MSKSTKHPVKTCYPSALNYLQRRHSRFQYRAWLLLCMLFCFSALQEGWATTYTSNVATGNWGNSSSWSPTGIPGSGDIVTIKDGHNIALTSNAMCSSLTIEMNSDGESILSLNGNTLSLGSINFNPGGGDKKVRLNFGTGTLEVSGTITFPSGAGQRSNVILSYTTSSIIKFNGSATQTLNLPSNIIYPNIHIINATGVTPNAAITATNITGDIVILGGKFNNGGYNIVGATGKTFEIKSGATFVATGSTSFPTGFTPTLNSGSTVEYAGTGQSIAALNYSNLKITGTGTQLGGPMTLNQNMNLSNGNLNLNNNSVFLGNFDLTVQQGSSITNANAANYIRQTGSGKLIMANLGTGGTASEVLFPIGTASSYTPAYITNTGTADNFSIRVADDIRDNYNTLLTANVVKKTWYVEQETSNGTANVTLKLQWNATDEGSPFNRAKVGISHYFSNTWHQPSSFVAASGSGPYSITLSGLDHFSPFGVGDENSPLPVELISFNAIKKENGAMLKWVTASEKNNKGFQVQTSTNGRNFEDLSFVASRNPNSASTQQYEFLDKTATGSGLRYYRLKQTDFDGTVSFSEIKVVNLGKARNIPVIYPNPFSNQLNVQVHTDKDETMSYYITDISGKTVYKNNKKLTQGDNLIQIELENECPAGFYLLHTQTSSGATSNRLIKQ